MLQVLWELFFYLLSLMIGSGVSAFQYAILPLIARGPILASSGLIIGTAIFFGLSGSSFTES